MISTIDILLQPPNSRVLKAVKVVIVELNALETCAELIRKDEYSSAYDFDDDGYITADDYETLYNLFYGKWNMWHTDDIEADIRALVRIEKYVNGLTPVDSSYDLDNDGVISRQDSVIMRRWLLLGKTKKETFNNET